MIIPGEELEESACEDSPSSDWVTGWLGRPRALSKNEERLVSKLVALNFPKLKTLDIGGGFTPTIHNVNFLFLICYYKSNTVPRPDYGILLKIKTTPPTSSTDSTFEPRSFSRCCALSCGSILPEELAFVA